MIVPSGISSTITKTSCCHQENGDSAAVHKVEIGGQFQRRNRFQKESDNVTFPNCWRFRTLSFSMDCTECTFGDLLDALPCGSIWAIWWYSSSASCQSHSPASMAHAWPGDATGTVSIWSGVMSP